MAKKYEGLTNFEKNSIKAYENLISVKNNIARVLQVSLKRLIKNK